MVKTPLFLVEFAHVEVNQGGSVLEIHMLAVFHRHLEVMACRVGLPLFHLDFSQFAGVDGDTQIVMGHHQLKVHGLAQQAVGQGVMEQLALDDADTIECVCLDSQGLVTILVAKVVEEFQ